MAHFGFTRANNIAASRSITKKKNKIKIRVSTATSAIHSLELEQPLPCVRTAPSTEGFPIRDGGFRIKLRGLE